MYPTVNILNSLLLDQQTQAHLFINILTIVKLKHNYKQENSIHKKFINCPFIRKGKNYILLFTRQINNDREERE